MQPRLTNTPSKAVGIIQTVFAYGAPTVVHGAVTKPETSMKGVGNLADKE